MKKQIPNILSVLRLFMVPVFIYCYFTFSSGTKSLIATGVYVLAWFTDALDGYLARRNNWITDAGKILDPLADKFMQLAAAVCFTVDNKVFLFVVIPLLIKEFGMLFAAIRIMKTQKVVVSSSWYGKVTTVVLFLCAFSRTAIRGNAELDICLVIIMVSMMIFSLLMYYFKDFKGKYNQEIFKPKH